jgi:anti-sigma regulatory factor (Ser/Thr protein kinase)
MTWDCEARFAFRVPNDVKMISRLSTSLARLGVSSGRCPEEMERQIAIALGEAISNAIIHGNLEVGSQLREQGREREFCALIQQRAVEHPYCCRTVEIETSIYADSISWRIADDGPGFVPSRLPDPLSEENRRRCTGRGVLMMRAFFDEVCFNGKGNEVTLTVYGQPRRLAWAM